MTTCTVCGAELVEVDRWTFNVADFAAEKRRQFGPGAILTPTEVARVEAMIGANSEWRQLACPSDPAHVEFYAERVDP